MIREIMTRYSESDKIIVDNAEMYEIRDNIDTSERDSDEYYFVKEGDTLRGISFIKYSDARFWWIIAEFNDILDPYEKLEVGKELRCPSLSRIRGEIV